MLTTFQRCPKVLNCFVYYLISCNTLTVVNGEGVYAHKSVLGLVSTAFHQDVGSTTVTLQG